MARSLELARFDEVDLEDPFFTSLRRQYAEFPDWFARKSRSGERAYVLRRTGRSLRGFVYLKVEDGPLDDVHPPRPSARRLKVGTMKIDAHGTKLGERVLKKIFDHAVSEHVDEIYVTIFDSHAALIALFGRYGFVEQAVKQTPNGEERVLVRSMRRLTGDIRADYPFVHTAGRRFWLLAIYPDYHSHLFPDSILNTESPDILRDVSHTNTIHKVYVARLALSRIRPGDVVVIYRTTDIPGRARFRSVATSVCVAEEVRAKRDFADAAAVVGFAGDHSVFEDRELEEWYASPDRLFALRMTYNVALPRRPTRQMLLEEVGVTEQPRWDLRRLDREQFLRIMEAGGADEGLVVD